MDELNNQEPEVVTPNVVQAQESLPQVDDQSLAKEYQAQELETNLGQADNPIAYNQSREAAKLNDSAKLAEANKLARIYNVPAFFVAENLEKFRDSYNDEFNGYDEVNLKSKRLTKWMEDPKNATISKGDDLNNLAKVDGVRQLVKTYNDDDFTSYGDELRAAATRGTKQVGLSVKAMAGMFGRADAREMAKELSQGYKEVEDNAIKFETPESKEFNLVLEKEAGELDAAMKSILPTTEELVSMKPWEIPYYTLRSALNTAKTGYEFLDLIGRTLVYRPKQTTVKAVESLPMSGIVMGTGAATGAAGFFAAGPAGALYGGAAGAGTSSAIMETGAWFQQGMIDRKLNPTSEDDVYKALTDPTISTEIRNEAMRKGITLGVVDGAMQVVGGRFFTTAPKSAAKAAKSYAKKGPMGKLVDHVASIENKAGSFAKATASEMAGESLSEGASQAAAYLDLGKVDWGDVAFEGIVSPIQSGGTAAVMSLGARARSNKFMADTFDTIQERNEAEDTLQTVKAMQELNTIASESTTQQLDSETFAELAQNTALGDADKKVYFQKSQWNEFWESKGEDPTLMFEQLLGQNIQDGSSIEVGLKEFVQTFTGTDNYQPLLDIVRQRPDGMTVDDALTALKNLPNKVSELAQVAEQEISRQEQIKSETTALRKKVQSQIEMSKGPNPRQNAEIISGMVESMAQDFGMTVREVEQNYLGGIYNEVMAQDTTDARVLEQQSIDTLPNESIEGRHERITGRVRQRQFSGPIQEIASSTEEAQRISSEPIRNTPSGRKHSQLVRDAAKRYADSRGLDYVQQSEYVSVDTGRATRIAEAYSAMEHKPNDPEVLAAYQALIAETLAQYQIIKETGLVVQVITEDMEAPYVTSQDMIDDVLNNNNMWLYPTDSGFGTLTDIQDNPLLGDSGETIGDFKLTHNDIFRIVHDYFGHVKEGNGFRAKGEENAWQSHVRMYSKQAARAMTSETRGQNSWLNFGPFGEANRTANVNDTVFADQKVGLLPDWVMEEGLSESDVIPYQDVEQRSQEPRKLFQESQKQPVAPEFYSKLLKTIRDKAQNKMTTAQLRALVREEKQEEVSRTGLKAFMDSKQDGDMVTKDEVIALVEDGAVQIKQVTLSARDRKERMATKPREQEEVAEGETPLTPEQKQLIKETRKKLFDKLTEDGEVKIVYGFEQYDNPEYFTEAEEAAESRSNEMDYYIDNYEDDYYTVTEIEIDGETKYYLHPDSGETFEELNETLYDSESAAEEELRSRAEDSARNNADESFSEVQIYKFDKNEHSDLVDDSDYLDDLTENDLNFDYMLLDQNNEPVLNPGSEFGTYDGVYEIARKLSTETNAEESINEIYELRKDEIKKLTKEEIASLDDDYYKNKKTVYSYPEFYGYSGELLDYSETLKQAQEQLRNSIERQVEEEIREKLFSPEGYEGYKVVDLTDPSLTPERYDESSGRETSKVRWASTVMDGPAENYNEDLLIYDNAPGNRRFVQSGHFADEDIVVHLRTDQRETDKGLSLVAQEIQADWQKETFRESQRENKKGTPPTPFTNYEELGFRALVRKAIDAGINRVSWTTGKIQNARNNLAQVVDKIEFYQTEDGPYEIKAFRDGREVKRQQFENLDAIGDEFSQTTVNEIKKSQETSEKPDFKKRKKELEKTHDKLSKELRSLEEEFANIKKETLEQAKQELGANEKYVSQGEISDKYRDLIDENKRSFELHDLINEKEQEVYEAYRNMEATQTTPVLYTMEGDNLQVGRKGLTQLYDEKLVKYANKYMKKYGAQVETAKVATRTGAMVPDMRQAHKYLTEELNIKSFDDLRYSESGYGKNERKEFYIDQYIGVQKLNSGTVTVEIFDRDGETILSRQYTSEAFEEFLKKKNEEIEVGDTEVFDTELHSIVIPEQLKKDILAQGQVLFQENNAWLEVGADKVMKMFLTGRANASSIIHESAHMYLEMVRDIAQGGNEAAQARLQQISAEFGIPETGMIPREVHERFAREFEAYMMNPESKAPARRYRKLFAHFASFLADIYGSVKSFVERMKAEENLDIKVNKNVADIFERMLVSQKEIEMASNASPEPTFNNFLDRLPKTFADKYVEAQERAKEDATARLFKRLLKTAQKKKTKAYRVKLAQVRKQVTDEVNDMPVYNMLNIMRHGKSLNKETLPDEMDKLRFNRKEIELLYPEMLKLPIMNGIVSRDGLPIQILSEIFGYKKRDDLMYDLRLLPTRNDFINERIDQQMGEWTNDMMFDEKALQQQAEREINNLDRSSYIRMEYEFLADNNKGIVNEATRRVVAHPIPDKNMKSQAEYQIGNTTISNIKPHVYRNAERRAAKEAGRLFSKNDHQGAFDAKERQLLYSYLYQNSQDAKDFIDKKNKDFKKFFKPDKELAKYRDMNLVQGARAMLAIYGMGGAKEDPMSYVQSLKSYNDEAYKHISELMTNLLKDPKPYDQMTFAEFNDMTDLMDSLWSLSRESKTIESRGQKVLIDQAAQDVVASIIQNDKREFKEKERKTISWLEKLKTDFLTLEARVSMYSFWINAKDGGKPGVARQYLYEPIEMAHAQFSELNTKYLRKYLDILKSMEKRIGDVVEIQADEINFTFRTKAELLGALYHIGNPSNKRKLLLGYQWAEVNQETGELDTRKWDAFLNRMFAENVITKKDMDDIQAVWNLNEEMKPMIQKANRKIFGFYFKEIKNESFETPFGTYQGGYVPAALDRYAEPDIAMKADFESLVQGSFANNLPYTGGKGMTLERNENFAGRLDLDPTRMAGHIRDVIKFSTMKPAVIDVFKMIKQKDLSARINQENPATINSLIIPTLNRADKLTKGEKTKGSSAMLSKAMGEIKKSAAMQILAFSAQNILEQYGQYFASMTKTGVGNSLKSTGMRILGRVHIINSENTYAKTLDQIKELDPVFAARHNNDSFEVQREMEALFKVEEGVLPKLTKSRLNLSRVAGNYAFIGQRVTQEILDADTWTSAFNKAILEGKTEEQAVIEARNTLDLTQFSRRPFDSSAATSNELLGFFHMFLDYFNAVYNLQKSESAIALRARDKTKAETAARLFLVYILTVGSASAATALVRRALAGKFDLDDDDEYLDEFADILIMNPVKMYAAMVPIVGPATVAGVMRKYGQPYEGRISASPAVEAVAAASYFATRLSNGEIFYDKEKDKWDFRTPISTLGTLVGLPLGPLAKPINYVQKWDQGEVKPTGPIDAARGLVTGQ